MVSIISHLVILKKLDDDDGDFVRLTLMHVTLNSMDKSQSTKYQK